MTINALKREIEDAKEAMRKRDEQERVLRKLNAITNEDLDREREQREELERELEACNAREEELNGVIAEMQQALEEERATKAKLEAQLIGLAEYIVKM
jgi:chromosome segregation ATPase